MGLTGSAGQVFLLWALLLSAFRRDTSFPSKDVTAAAAPAAVLNVSLFLFASAGGFAVLFSIFINPTIRGYDRVAPLLLFFSLFAVSLGVARIEAWVYQKGGRALSGVFYAGLLCLTALGLADQYGAQFVNQDHLGNMLREQQRYAAFVQEVEERLPEGAMVCVLPNATIGVRHPGVPEADGYKPHLFSKNLKWSTGGFSLESQKWYEAIQAGSSEEAVENLMKSGFDGIWIFKAAYPAAIEEILEQHRARKGVEVFESPGKRFALVNLTERRKAYVNAMGAEAYALQRKEFLEAPFNPIALGASRPITPGTRSEDSAGSAVHLWAGWEPTSPSGAWSKGDEASVRFLLEKGGAPLLELMCAGSRPMDLHVTLNDRQTLVVPIDGRAEKHSLRFEASAYTRSNELWLHGVAPRNRTANPEEKGKPYRFFMHQLLIENPAK